MFTRANPTGWAIYDKLTSAQINQIDLNASRAIDGDAGGSYSPSGPITISGTVNVHTLSVTNLIGIDDLEVGVFYGEYIYANQKLSSLVSTVFSGGVTSTGSFWQYGSQNFWVTSSGEFKISNGTFKLESTSTFDATLYFNGSNLMQIANTVDLDIYTIPDFKAGFVSSGTCHFYDADCAVFWSKPTFVDGLYLPPGKFVEYSSAASWYVIFPFSQGIHLAYPSTVNAYYQLQTNGVLGQTSNANPSLSNLRCHPILLQGGVPVTVTQVSIITAGNNISGTLGSGTTFDIMYLDSAFNIIGTDIITDTDPHGAIHANVWTGSRTYDPTTTFVMIRFNGYGGTDTLSSIKTYNIYTVRFQFSTTKKGYY